MEMQLDALNFVSILSALDPALRQFLVFGGAFLLLAIPVIVLKVTSCPVAIATGDFDRLEIFDHYGPFDDFGPYICLALLVICGGLSGGLISYELVRSYAFSPLWYYVLPAVSGASVYFQYVSYRYPVFIKALSDDDSDVRRHAAEALGKLGDKRAVDPLINALADDDSIVRRDAAEALGLLGDKRAVDPLIKALGDKEEWVRRTAAKALEQLGQPEWAQYVRGDDDDFRRLGSSKDPRAVDPLIKALAEPDYIYDIRQAVAKALGHLGDKRAIDPLIKALADNDSMVRKVAAEALEQLGQPEWAQYVRGDDDDFHRLGSSKDPKAVDPLIKALADWHDDVRKNAVKALGLLGDKRAIDPLIKVLADDNSIVRDAADEALKKLGYKK